MSENSKIEWTTHTFNPWIGCTKVSPGCAHCYAENLMDVRYGRVKWGKGNPRQRTSSANWKLPLKWNKTPWICDNCGGAFRHPCHHYTDDQQTYRCPNISTGYHKARVFCASLADWLDDDVPIEWLADLLAVIHATPNLEWLLLTKRPENFQTQLLSAGIHMMGYRNGQISAKPCALPSTDEDTIESVLGWSKLETFPSNVWIGTSVEDQQRGNERIPSLLKIPAKVRFISCEPLIGPVNLDVFLSWNGERESKGIPNPLGSALRSLTDVTGVDWVICGGESGPKARPMNPDWAKSLRDQCHSARVPFLFKQWGEYDSMLHKVGKHASGRLLDGREWNEFPNVR